MFYIMKVQNRARIAHPDCIPPALDRLCAGSVDQGRIWIQQQGIPARIVIQAASSLNLVSISYTTSQLGHHTR